METRQYLNDHQIRTFLEDGVLVVENVLSHDETERSIHRLHQTLARCGVQSPRVDDEESAIEFSKLSSTNGSGGVLDIFYDEWKMEIATNPKLFGITAELWKEAHCHNGEDKESLSPENQFKWHPYGAFDWNKGYMYIDRIGYRLPTKVADELGNRINGQKKKKARSIQRSLTPHLDCCPEKLYEDAAKWRPIQCFVSLTDNMDPDTGGFEAANGFHRTFDEWSRNREPTRVIQKQANGEKRELQVPAPCVGAYTHMRPKEDQEVMLRVKHVPVRAGSAVFWDQRLPHANAYRHVGATARAVVYSSFLPDVELNRRYVREQLAKWGAGIPPNDQWNNIQDDKEEQQVPNMQLTPIGRKLAGLDPW
jgi:hypothetical protein